jgi:two-component system, chemotaxis family, protein-glutamate methylesterase/glutaminase
MTVTGAEPGPAGTGGRYGLVVVGSSAGGIAALSEVLGGLPAGFPVPVLVVQHLDRRHDTILAQVLGRRALLPVKLALAGERANPGTVYLAPPNHHLLVDAGGLLRLSDSDLVHFVRPSADLLFESAARAYGARTIACVLTGTGRDGAAGVSAVKSHGGTVIAEDPGSAQFDGMPGAAVGTGAVDFVLPLQEIAPKVRGLVEAGRQ